MSMMTETTRSEPPPVWRLFASVGAPEPAIEWAKGYGSDLRRAWDECLHGELMLPVAAGFGCDPSLVTLVGHDCVRSSIEGLIPYEEPFTVLKAVERYATGVMCNGEFAEALQKGKNAALAYDAKRVELGSVSTRITLSIGGGALYLGTGRGNQALHGFHEGLISAAKIRLLLSDNEKRLHHTIRVRIIVQALHEFADRTRAMLPWHSLASSIFGKAVRQLSEEDHVELRG